MARIVTGGLTTFNLGTHLDPMTLELYGIADYLRTPVYIGGQWKVTIDSSGRFGIGTATPAEKLDVVLTRGNWRTVERDLGIFGSSIALAGYGAYYYYGEGGSNNGWFHGKLQDSNANAFVLSNSTTGFGGTFTEQLRVDASGNTQPGSDNSKTLGTASRRWSVVYAATGSINTSDAREKTELKPMSGDEIAAARQIAGEIGTFRFLSALKEKGDAARTHVGLTVQRVVEILQAHGLDPLRYAFICHDKWPAKTIEHRAVTVPHESLVDADGQPVQVVVEPAYKELIPGGDRYGFRVDELLMFAVRGLAESQVSLEQRVQALESGA
jgi:hypothetical protein